MNQLPPDIMPAVLPAHCMRIAPFTRLIVLTMLATMLANRLLVMVAARVNLVLMGLCVVMRVVEIVLMMNTVLMMPR